jgi:hypothetical protein
MCHAEKQSTVSERTEFERFSWKVRNRDTMPGGPGQTPLSRRIRLSEMRKRRPLQAFDPQSVPV